MHKKYPHMFSPIKIGKGGLIFKNRVWTAPAAVHLLSAGEEYPTDAVIAYYREKARGGAACITFSCQNTDRNAPHDDVHSDQNIYNARYHRYWRKLTDAIHFFDARASLELLAFTRHDYDENDMLICYTPCGEVEDGGVYPMIPREGLERMADDYAEAAECAVRVGFDMILLHFGHGVFPAQFLSPKYNTRADEFGGSAENRARFPVMIIDRIRERIGPYIPIEVRLSGDELVEGGGTIADCIDFLRRVEDRIDLAHISCGTVVEPLTQTVMHPVEFYKPGVNAKYARAVKAAGLSIPVLTLGAFQRPELIEETLASGGADVVAMARGAIADAECINKAREGREDEIIPCLKCFYCLAYDTETAFACSVNPRIGREAYLGQFIPESASPRKVVIIGGGPAGLSAAAYAARRGHDVTLYERQERLGGKIVFARHVEFKYDLNNFLEYLLYSVRHTGVKLITGVAATPELISAVNADVVMAAVGSDPVSLPIPGAEGKNVFFAEQVFGRLDQVGENTVVIGGGEVGCETALYLAMQGARRVSVVEMRSELAPDANYAPWLAINDLTQKRCDVRLNATCSKITEQGVTYIDLDDAEHFIKADTVIFAVGTRSRTDEAEAFRDCAPQFFKLGDCYAARNIRVCTRTAFDATMQI